MVKVKHIEKLAIKIDRLAQETDRLSEKFHAEFDGKPIEEQRKAVKWYYPKVTSIARTRVAALVDYQKIIEDGIKNLEHEIGMWITQDCG